MHILPHGFRDYLWRDIEVPLPPSHVDPFASEFKYLASVQRLSNPIACLPLSLWPQIYPKPHIFIVSNLPYTSQFIFYELHVCTALFGRIWAFVLTNGRTRCHVLFRSGCGFQYWHTHVRFQFFFCVELTAVCVERGCMTSYVLVSPCASERRRTGSMCAPVRSATY